MIDLTESEYLHIKDVAHRLFLHTPVGATKAHGIATERYFVSMCYTKAVYGFLKSKGLIDEAAETKYKENRYSKTEG